jgi:hypothetical protein
MGRERAGRVHNTEGRSSTLRPSAAWQLEPGFQLLHSASCHTSHMQAEPTCGFHNEPHKISSPGRTEMSVSILRCYNVSRRLYLSKETVGMYIFHVCSAHVRYVQPLDRTRSHGVPWQTPNAATYWSAFPSCAREVPGSISRAGMTFFVTFLSQCRLIPGRRPKLAGRQFPSDKF